MKFYRAEVDGYGFQIYRFTELGIVHAYVLLSKYRNFNKKTKSYVISQK